MEKLLTFIAIGTDTFVTKSSSKDIVLNYEIAMELVEYIYCGTVRGSTLFGKELAALADCLNLTSFHETLGYSCQSRDYKSLQVCESLAKGNVIYEQISQPDYIQCVNTKTLSDVTFNVQGTGFSAHKVCRVFSEFIGRQFSVLEATISKHFFLGRCLKLLNLNKLWMM